MLIVSVSLKRRLFRFVASLRTGRLCGFLWLAISLVIAQSSAPSLSAGAFPDRLPSQFATEAIWEDLSFTEPVAILSAPGESNRLFVVEKTGKVQVLQSLDHPTASVFLDITDRCAPNVPLTDWGLLNMVFHPGFQTNGYFFLFYTTETPETQGAGGYFRLSRFHVDPTDPNKASGDSETILIQQRDEDTFHAGSALEFGPDGYLYVSIGDEGRYQDVLGNSQHIDKDFFGGILRLDVDLRPGSLPSNPHPAASTNYAVPPDNPFVGVTSFLGRPVDPNSVRTEFYAVGLRSPWRFSFDPATGLLYCNDVGQFLAEEMDFIFRGGNYGWSNKEAFETEPLRTPHGDSAHYNFIPPIAWYGRETGTCLGGALLYRGDKFPTLSGAYLFSDFTAQRLGFIPAMPQHIVLQAQDLFTRIGALERELDQSSAELEAAENAWDESRPVYWHPFTLRSFSSTNAILSQFSDASLLASGSNSGFDVYTLMASEVGAPILGIRLEALTDSTLPGNGPGRSDDVWGQGAFIVSAFRASVANSDSNDWQPLNLTNVLASARQIDSRSWTEDKMLDEDPATGWGIFPEVGRRHFAVFQVAEPNATAGAKKLKLEIENAAVAGYNLGKFKVSYTTEPLALQNIHLTDEAFTVLQVAPTARTPQQQEVLHSYYRSIAPELTPVRAQIRALYQEFYDLIKTNQSPITWIATGPAVSSFGINPATGDILMLDLVEGKIRRLIHTDAQDAALPPSLAETDLFTDVAKFQLRDDIVPYQINTPFWSDNARKSRWVFKPGGSEPFKFSAEGNWEFPAGTLWIKHFDLEMTLGDPSTKRRISTRVLVKTTDGVYGVAYKWDQSQTNAYLLPEEGEDETFTIMDHGAPRTQVWRYPSRSECLQCHTPGAGFSLGFNTAQLNREVMIQGHATNQLKHFANVGYLDHPPDSGVLPRLSAINDSTAPVGARVLSYFAANCSPCHHPGAPLRANWDARGSTPLLEKLLINYPPLDNSSGSSLVEPGSIARSVLYQRVSTFEGHMPPIATSVLNADAIALLQEWIEQDLPGPVRINGAELTEEGNLKLRASGYTPKLPVVERSVDFLNWLPEYTNDLRNGSFIFTSTNSVDQFPKRFYRLQLRD